jgi:hypothetical protein
VVDHPARTAWLADLERETASHREARARGHERAARRNRDLARWAGFSDPYAKDRARWHLARAKGQRERFDNVRECEQRQIMQSLCAACGSLREQNTRCRIGILCRSCRDRRKGRARVRFARARDVVLHEAIRAGVTHPGRPGGAYSEKLFTLTLPHLEEHDVATRIAFVLAAWAYFLKSMNVWLRACDDAGRTVWLRHVEWTAGKSDAGGHPHIHVWFFGPFLPRDLLSQWWREALVRVGFSSEGGSLAQAEILSALIIDIRQVRSGRVDEGHGIVSEVIKYMTKDIIAPGQYVDAGTYARVYEAFDGRRSMQASSGFLALGKADAGCPDCAETRSTVVRFLRDAASSPEWRGSIEAKRRLRDAKHTTDVVPGDAACFRAAHAEEGQTHCVDTVAGRPAAHGCPSPPTHAVPDAEPDVPDGGIP